MAINKKSFLLYCDLIHTVQKLPDDKAGLLFKHILGYVNDNEPETDDLLVQVSFEPIKQQLKRDLASWEDTLSQKSDAGLTSALNRLRDRIANYSQKELERSISNFKDKLLQKPNDRYLLASVNIVNERLTESTPVKSVTAVSTVNVTVNDNVTLLDSVSSPPIGVDPLHFYIAKGFHKVFIEQNPNAKHLKEATVSNWVKTSRLIIENDKTSIDRLLAIKWYFELGIKKTKGIDTFYLENTSSISAFRGKSKNGAYKIDNIFKGVFKWLEEDTSRHSEVFKRRDNLLQLVAECQN